MRLSAGRTLTLAVIVSVANDAGSIRAQWLNHPTSGLPRNADGMADLSAPTPRLPNGKPNLSGVWRPPSTSAPRMTLGASFQSWAEAVSQERMDNNAKDMPRARCLPLGMPLMLLAPFPLKIIHTPDLFVSLHEAEGAFRQIFLDGRDLPHDPQPTWRGYSVGRWDGDELVVTTIGLNDRGWLDAQGHPTSETLRLTERYRRRDLGHLMLQVTYEDPKVLVGPWTSPAVEYLLMSDTDLLEEVCLENEKSSIHYVGK